MIELGEIKSRRLLAVKGALFLLLGIMALALNLLSDGLAVRGAAALAAVWAFCRFYYFLFYVLERYVDPRLKYAGLCALLRAARARSKERLPQPETVSADEPAAGAGQAGKSVAGRGKPIRTARLGAAAGLLLWAGWFAGQLLRDKYWLSGLLFYLPSPAVAAALPVCAWLAWRGGRRGTAGVLLLLAVAPAVAVTCVENRLLAPPVALAKGEGVPLRLVHWNVCSGHYGWDVVQDELNRCAPDLCVVTEFPRGEDAVTTAARFGPEYRAEQFGNLTVIARGELRERIEFRAAGGVRACGVVWRSRAGECRVLVVDLPSNVLLPREPRLLEVRRVMEEWRPDLVVGDFNAPRRSRALSPPPPGYAHAYEAAGTGFSYSWPMPCPLYAIDQCLIGPRVRPVAYRLESSWRSDHRRQVCEFWLKPGNVNSVTSGR